MDLPCDLELPCDMDIGAELVPDEAVLSFDELQAVTVRTAAEATKAAEIRVAVRMKSPFDNVKANRTE